MFKRWIVLVNNCIAKWRLGAWNIQGLPLLAASPQLQSNPAMHPHTQKKQNQACDTLKKDINGGKLNKKGSETG